MVITDASLHDLVGDEGFNVGTKFGQVFRRCCCAVALQGAVDNRLRQAWIEFAAGPLGNQDKRITVFAEVLAMNLPTARRAWRRGWRR